jgi:hypothetical protein
MGEPMIVVGEAELSDGSELRTAVPTTRNRRVGVVRSR